MRSLEHGFRLAAEAEETFDLFSRPERLNELTPKWFDLVPRTPGPHRLRLGLEIPYRFRWRGLPMPWTSRIVELEPPFRLTYEQARGPYLSFRHEHTFEPENGGTRVVDRVLYRALGGYPLDRLLIRPDLERIFEHRARAARVILAAKPPHEPPPKRVGPPIGRSGAQTLG